MTATILVADDALNVRQLVRTILARAGYSTAEASTGPDTIRVVEQARPTLLLLDVDLPVINGYDVCARLRAQNAFPWLKIIILTAHAMDEDRHRAERAGADAFITKPFRPIALMATISALLAGTDAPERLGDARSRPLPPLMETFTVPSRSDISGCADYGTERTSNNGT